MIIPFVPPIVQILSQISHTLIILTTPLFVSILDLTVFLSDSTNSSSQTSSSVSIDTFPSSHNSFIVLPQPPFNPIPITPSLNTTPINTPRHTPLPTSVQQQTQTSLTLPLSDTEFSLTPFHVTSSHSPPSSLLHIPDPSDIDPLLLRNLNNPNQRKSIIIPTSIKSFRRRSQFDDSLPLPPPCSHLPSQPSSSIPPPKALKIPAHELFDSLQKKSDMSEVDFS